MVLRIQPAIGLHFSILIVFLDTDDIRSIYLNKTEIAYMLNMPPRSQLVKEASSGRRGNEKQSRSGATGQIDSSSGASKEEPFDNHLNFIFVVQPFTQIFARVLYPFDDSLDDDELASAVGVAGYGNQIESYQPHSSLAAPVLFINDEYLIVAESDNVKYAKTDKIFSLIGKKAGANTNADNFDKPFYPMGGSKVPGFDQKAKLIRYFDGKTATSYDPVLEAATSRMQLGGGRGP